MATKPTIVVVPGAWHGPEHFEPTSSLLTAAGYTVKPVTLASVGANPPVDDIQPDVEIIRSTIEAAADNEEDVIVVMHSYGSMPAGEAVKGLDKVTRRKDGKQGGVSHLLYLAAFVIPKGKSQWDGLGGQPLPWFNIASDEKTLTADDPVKVFYHDVPKELQESSVKALKPHSFGTFKSKTTWEPYRDIPSTYCHCEDDAALPYEIQKGMLEGSKGVKWETESLKASHSPFLSMPEETAKMIRKVAGETL